MPEVTRIAVVILAAGGSRRMGQPKQNLIVLGKTLLQNTIDAAKEVSRSVTVFGAIADVFVVLGANMESVCDNNVFDGCRILVNESWSEGLSSSIKCAVNTISQTSETVYDSVLFTVADLAYIEGKHLVRLIQAASTSDLPVVCSASSERSVSEPILGVPALFKRECFADLLSLSGDVGARKIIAKYSDRVVAIPLEIAAFDIDTMADYQRIRSE